MQAAMADPQAEEKCSGDVGETEQEVKEEIREPILFKRHIKYFERVLNCLPCSLSKLDSNR